MAKLSQLLLYDPDPSGLETLTYVFQKNGCAVTATSDADKLIELVQMLTPGSPLVLVVLRHPEQKGLEVIREITGNPRTRNLACVAIGQANLRGAAIQAGAFGLLSSPVFVRDVLDASKLVAAATVPGSRPSPDTEISIKLSEVGGIYFLIRALAATGRSAAVEVQRGPRRGELRFIDGDLSSVQIGGLSGLSALHQALLWDEAELRLKFRNVVRRGGQLSLKSEELIEECDRFLRDFAHEAKDLGVARTIYRPGRVTVQPTAALPSEVVPLLRLLDGTRDLSQILDESPFRVFDTLRIVKQFAAAEAIRADAPPAAPSDGGVAVAPAVLGDWFQQMQPASGADPTGTVGESSRGRASSPGLTSRPSSPFVSVSVSVATGANNRANNKPPGEDAQAKRTLTRRDYPIKSAAAAAIGPGDSRPPGSPLTGVARGEIQTAPAPIKKVGGPTKPSVPSVLVELGAIPVVRPPSPGGPVVVPGRSVPPSVVIEPVTPPPVMNVPPLLAPVTAARVALAVPAATLVPSPVTKPSGAAQAEPTQHVRTPSNSFNAVEADFFDREADLYKKESAETFDDLEGTGGTRRPGPAGKS